MSSLSIQVTDPNSPASRGTTLVIVSQANIQKGGDVDYIVLSSEQALELAKRLQSENFGADQ